MKSKDDFMRKYLIVFTAFLVLFFSINVLADISSVTVENITTNDKIKGTFSCTGNELINFKIFESNAAPDSSPIYIESKHCQQVEMPFELNYRLQQGQYRLEAHSSDQKCNVCLSKRYFNVTLAFSGASVYEMPLLFVLIILAVILYLIKRKKTQREVKKQE